MKGTENSLDWAGWFFYSLVHICEFTPPRPAVKDLKVHTASQTPSLYPHHHDVFPTRSGPLRKYILLVRRSATDPNRSRYRVT